MPGQVRTADESSQWPADLSEPVLETTVGGVLEAAAAAFGDQPALSVAAPGQGIVGRWSYHDLLRESTAVATALLEHYRPGERVGLWAPNGQRWVALELAAGRAGLALVPINPAFRRDELVHVLRSADAKGLFTVAEFRGHAMRPTAEDARRDLPGLREVVDIDADWNRLSAGSGGSGSSARLPPVSPDDVAEVQFTSGTTGVPKGVVLTHRSVTNGPRFVFSRLALGPGATVVHAMPMFHTGGACLLTLGAIQAGAHHVLMETFDPGLWLELVESERADVIMGVPTMFHMMLGHPDAATRDLSSLKIVCAGGAGIAPTLMQALQTRLDARYAAVYGQTEGSGALAMSAPGDPPVDTATSLGRPLPNIEAKIVDVAGGQTVPFGRTGELCVRGVPVMLGYDGLPDETAATIDGDGWLHTGDLCRMSESGELHVAGRLKELIHRGGENISPVEIENVLSGHPDVDMVAVVGVPDEKWGEQIAAFVRPSGDEVDGPALSEFVRERIAAFKRPRVWVAIDSFPLTPSGKIKKHELVHAWNRGVFERVQTTP
jgi:fatty-acyl-CoA synthase